MVYLPPGTYKVTSDILIQSVQGFVLRGAGPSQTTLRASGSGFTTAVLLIDGSADGVFEGFAVQGDGTEQVTDGIRLDWTTAAARSTTGNMFRDIRVRSLSCVTGFSLEGNGSRQVDGTIMHNVVVSGSQVTGSWSSSGNWQNGFALGNGTFGNNYNHVQAGCGSSGFYYGWKVNASGLALYGAQPAGNYCDFWMLPGAQSTLSNIQSQSCGQFLTTASPFSPIPVSLTDINVKTANAALSGNTMLTITGGVWHVKNLDVTASSGASYVSTQIVVSGTSASRPCVATFDNVAMYNSRASGFVFTNNNVNVNIRNYSNYNPATGVYTTAAGDVSSWYAGGAWTVPGSAGTVPQVNFYAAGTTWTKPAGAQTVFATALGGGGGAGSGAAENSGTVSCGGGGGGGGMLAARQFAAADLPSSVTVTVGAGGAGGASVTSGSGNAGSYGAGSSFGSYLTGAFGNPGSGGTSATGAGAASPFGVTSTAAGGRGIRVHDRRRGNQREPGSWPDGPGRAVRRWCHLRGSGRGRCGRQ